LGKGKHLFPLVVFISPPCGRTAGQRADAHSSPPDSWYVHNTTGPRPKQGI
jgi:hypothetical protein